MKKVFFILGIISLVVISSCSKNYYPATLLEHSDLDESHYEFPINANITKNDGESFDCTIISFNGKNYYYTVGENKNYERITVKEIKEVVFNEQPVVGQKVDVFFSEAAVKVKYEVICFFKWSFFAIFQEHRIVHECVNMHGKNCIKQGGDAVIIQPNLINSYVIKYL
jgi:hypothetical protein